MKALASPRIVLFLYGSAFSWVHSKERFRERSYSVKSPSSPRKALCKALFERARKRSERFLIGALAWTFGSAFVNSYGALSDHFRSALGALSEGFRSAFGDFRERSRERFTRTKLLKCKRSKCSKALGALSYI